ncbi:MAG: hypothetical protein WB608_20740 [Terracidiphilus sp.]
MAKRLLTAGFSWRAGLRLAVVIAPLCLSANGYALSGLLSLRHHKAPDQTQAPNKPTNSSQPPAFSIPVEPLGFFAPGAFYQGLRISLVSLDFIDENRLLFTFRTPGLIRRAAVGEDDEREIRALVLTLPKGTVEAEALWTLHDHGRYLWMLHDGHFLLRDRDNLEEGDATLALKPLLHFPGPLLWMEMDPAQQFLVTDSHEPEASSSSSGEVPSPATAAADVTSDGEDPAGKPDIVVRILRRSSGQVLLISHVRTTVHLPVNSDGYLEALRSSGRDWVLNMNYFTGGSRILGRMESACMPAMEFISPQQVLASTCGAGGGRGLVAMSTEGRRLWSVPTAPTQVWPLLVMAPNGSRLALETLTVPHPVEAFSPLNFDEVKSQLVEVYDAASAKLALKTSVSPVLDGGGNLAISPSGKRVAVLDAGAIQVYELASPPTMPESDIKHSAP